MQNTNSRRKISTRKTVAMTALGATLAGAVAVGGYAATSHADGASGGATGTVRTKSGPLTVRSGPSTSNAAVGSLKKGTKVKIICQTKGTRVNGTYGSSVWWDKIGSGKFVSDAYVYTGSDGRVAPLCGTPGGTGNGGSGKLPAAPRNNPYPAAMSKAPKLTKRAAFVRAEMQKAFPGIRCDVSAYRKGQQSDHNSGNALDCFPGTFGKYPTAGQLKTGNTAKNWLKKYANRLDVQYVIWQNKIWSVPRAAEGERNYGHAGEVTQGHYDHIHISVNAPVQH